ncbi:MAG: hypothetical protein JNJ49_12685 [Bdellovibrionaceae bacterium]|nr:hypothetical protein [Pseudobdellovibrionaceae bacterium]
MKLFSLLTLASLLLTGNLAAANCSIAVGGPGAKSDALYDLADSLREMFKKHKDLEVSVYTVDSLDDAMDMDSDFIVYLNGTAYSAEAQFRSIGSTRVYWEESFSAYRGLEEAISGITNGVETKVIPEILDYCSK